MKQSDLFKRGVTVGDMARLQDGLEKTHEDDTPFPVVTRDGMTVVGDVNKTENKAFDYNIRFRFTQQEAEELGIDPKEIIQTVGNYVIVRMEFENVSIKPRYDLEISAAIVRIFPYFYSINEETKKIGKRSDEETIEMVKEMSVEIGDDLYNIVAAVVGVDRRIVDHMMWNDVVDSVIKIMGDFPEVFNESEGFFPYSDSGK